MIEVIDHVEIHGIAYKFGVHGYVYTYHQVDGEWRKSEVPASEVREAMRRADRRAALKPPPKPKKVIKKRNKIPLSVRIVDVLLKSDVSLTRFEIAAQLEVPAQSISATLRTLLKQRRVLRAASKRVEGTLRPVNAFRPNRRFKEAA